MARAQGANALAVAAIAETTPQPALSKAAFANSAVAKAGETFRTKEISMDAASTLDGLPRARGPRAAQPSLFGAELQSKIIPFQPLPKVDGTPQKAPEPVPQIVNPATRKAAAKTATRKPAPAEDLQATLDFLPPAKTNARTLKTSAEAVIFCEAKVAAPIHRATASALDLGIILLAFGGVVYLFQTFGKPPSFDRITLLLLGAMLGMVALLYGLVFASFGAVTPGMKWTHLRLITFDGFALDRRARALRFVGSWMSVLSGGLGILWALLDEENLTWHDHMSKTFPTLRESNSRVVRQTRK